MRRRAFLGKYLSWECLILGKGMTHYFSRLCNGAGQIQLYCRIHLFYIVTLLSLTFDSLLRKLSLDILHFKLLPSYSCCYSHTLYTSLYFLHIVWVTYFFFTAATKWNSVIVYFSVTPARLGVCQDWDNLVTTVSSGWHRVGPQQMVLYLKSLCITERRKCLYIRRKKSGYER